MRTLLFLVHLWALGISAERDETLFMRHEGFWDILAPSAVVPGTNSVVFVRRKNDGPEGISAVLSVEDYYGKELFGKSWENQTYTDDFGLEFIVPEYTYPQRHKGTLKIGCSTTDKCPIGHVEFKIRSKIRQIDLFTEKTTYQLGENVKFYYGGINEDFHMDYFTVFHIWILDPKGSKAYEWRGLTLDKEDFGLIEYPLGLKAAAGDWRICSKEEGEIKVDGRVDCIGFTVIGPHGLREGTHHSDSALSSEKHFVDLYFGDNMKRTYLPGFPFTGKVLVDSTEEEVEISVRLMEVSLNESKVLDSETLLLKDEAIFDFMNVNSTGSKLILEAELISLGNENRSSPLLNAVLASEVIEKLPEEESACSLRIGEGLDRTFKPGDVTTVDVLASCPCDVLSELHWYINTREQILEWGKHSEKAPHQNGRCLHKISLPMLSRMAPKAVLKVWTHFVDKGNDDVLLLDSQNFSLTLKDTSLIILETNTTQISHSRNKIGIEVFAEPNVQICVYGSSGRQERDVSRTASDIIQSFRPGKYFWFYHCSRASEDGFYATSVLPPDPEYESTHWTLSSISISPEHGTRHSHDRVLERKKPLSVDFFLPENVKASESFMVDLHILSDMPLKLQVTVIFSISTESNELIFDGSQRHYDSEQANITGYEGLNLKKKITVSSSSAGGFPIIRTISAHVNAIAVIGGEDMEVESLYITRKIRISPPGDTILKKSLEYFCANDEDLSTTKRLGEWKTRSLSPLRNKQILFTIRESREVRIALTASDDKFEEDTEHQDDSNAFQVVLGAKKNTYSWIGTGIQDTDYQLITQKTPGILSPLRYNTFSISWKEGTLSLSTYNPSNHTFDRILSWPIQAFKPNFIGVKNLPGHENIDMRFWMENDESGYNEVFPLESREDCIPNSQNIGLFFSKGLVLPSLNIFQSPQREVECLEDVLEKLRDTLARYKTMGDTAELDKDLHESIQDLLYFKGVEGSLSFEFVRDSFRNSLELFYLLSDINDFFHVEQGLMKDLEEWINEYVRSMGQHLDYETTLQIVEWSDLDSKIIINVEKNILDVLEKEFSNNLGSNVSSPRLAYALLQMNSKHKSEALTQLYQRTLDDLSSSSGHDLVYVLLCLSHERNELTKRPELQSQIFDIIKTRVNELLPKSGYMLSRALSAHVYHESFFPYDLKMSVATSDLTTTSTLLINGNKDSSRRSNASTSHTYKQIFFSNNQMKSILPTKLYLLATGYGCGSMQISYTCSKPLNESITPAKEPQVVNKDYQVSLEMMEDQEDFLFLNICIRLTSPRKEHLLIGIKLFSGFDFESIIGIGRPKADWKIVKLEDRVLLHLSDVSMNCGSCFRLKFKRIFMVENLQPSVVYVQWRNTKDSFSPMYFHTSSRNSSLLNGLSETDLRTWFGSHQYNRDKGGVIASFDNQVICPCSMECTVLASETLVDTSETQGLVPLDSSTKTSANIQSTTNKFDKHSSGTEELQTPPLL